MLFLNVNIGNVIHLLCLKKVTFQWNRFDFIDLNTRKMRADIWKDGLIDFNGMSTRLGLFYAQKIGNRVHCTFMLTFLCCFLTQSLPSSSRVDTAVWMHYMDAYETGGEKA